MPCTLGHSCCREDREAAKQNGATLLTPHQEIQGNTLKTLIWPSSPPSHALWPLRKMPGVSGRQLSKHRCLLQPTLCNYINYFMFKAFIASSHLLHPLATLFSIAAGFSSTYGCNLGSRYSRQPWEWLLKIVVLMALPYLIITSRKSHLPCDLLREDQVDECNAKSPHMLMWQDTIRKSHLKEELWHNNRSK